MKVYLSKSNVSNLKLYNAVRAELETLDCEIVEFHGGVYDNTALLRSDMLVIVPPSNTLSISTGSSECEFDYIEDYYLGKGQAQQISDFVNKHHEWDNPDAEEQHIIHSDSKHLILVVTATDSERVMVDEFFGMISDGSDWKHTFARLELNEGMISLNNYIGPTKKRVSTSKKYNAVTFAEKPMLATMNLFKNLKP